MKERFSLFIAFVCLSFAGFFGGALLGGCGSDPGPLPESQARPRQAAPRRPHAFDETLVMPSTHPGLFSGAKDAQGRPVRVRCATCHEAMVPGAAQAGAARRGVFHSGVQIQHGGQTCQTCHNQPLYETFRLSDGKALPYAEVMDLCGQCHSRQRADYRAGLHGGMTGYWDLDRGPRERNNCLICHNPHRPAFPRVLPAPGPRYRFVEPPRGEAHE